MSKSDIAIQSDLWENNSVLKEKRENSNKQNYMPFLFRSKREGINNKSMSPPVGSYQIPSAFNSKNTESQPDFLKNQEKRKNQMCIFKSNQERFTINESHIPGPASYNYNNRDPRSTKIIKNIMPASKKLQEKMDLIKRSPSCPTIPDSNVRFGYVKDSQGNFKLIQKSESQIEKEKLKLKQYLSTLKGENQFMKRLELKNEPYLSKKNKKEHAILNNLEKYVERNSVSESRISSKSSKCREFAKLVKPKIKLLYGVNIEIQKEDHLGPGCYNVELDTLKKAKKDENFQFFNSSEMRFSPIVKEKPSNPYEHIFKEKKNLNMKEKIQGKIYKKSFPTNEIDSSLLEKDELPGPGYYDPEVETVKKSKGNIKFGSELRFKENVKDLTLQMEEQEPKNIVQKNDNQMKWGNLKKDKIKSPHKEFAPVNQSEIYGIMNEEQSSSNLTHQKLRLNLKKPKESAVFLDKSSRANISNKTYYQGESEDIIEESSSKLWKTKGSFMSRVPKESFETKEITPGPGTYQKISFDKKSFNIKNQ